MRWGFEYGMDSGTVGLMMFSANDLQEANQFVDECCQKHGFTHIANLKLVPPCCTIAMLRLLFPGYLPPRKLVDVE
jgi:hypothetical protein